jgi:hypothetical protein
VLDKAYDARARIRFHRRAHTGSFMSLIGVFAEP